MSAMIPGAPPVPGEYLVWVRWFAVAYWDGVLWRNAEGGRIFPHAVTYWYPLPQRPDAEAGRGATTA